MVGSSEAEDLPDESSVAHHASRKREQVVAVGQHGRNGLAHLRGRLVDAHLEQRQRLVRVSLPIESAVDGRELADPLHATRIRLAHPNDSHDFIGLFSGALLELLQIDFRVGFPVLNGPTLGRRREPRHFVFSQGGRQLDRAGRRRGSAERRQGGRGAPD